MQSQIENEIFLVVGINRPISRWVKAPKKPDESSSSLYFENALQSTDQALLKAKWVSGLIT
ncbi:hypothetical protein I7I48_04499 [Histoplasma ohiense]|nr:hypothetical protein I7I48_04499 [Histoplasma ohiense (nom. inval.)]